jgi:hypothetical protein
MEPDRNKADIHTSAPSGPTPTELDDDMESVLLAIAEWRAGDQGVPLDEAFRLVRESVRVDRQS